MAERLKISTNGSCPSAGLYMISLITSLPAGSGSVPVKVTAIVSVAPPTGCPLRSKPASASALAPGASAVRSRQVVSAGNSSGCARPLTVIVVTFTGAVPSSVTGLEAVEKLLPPLVVMAKAEATVASWLFRKVQRASFQLSMTEGEAAVAPWAWKAAYQASM